MSWSLRVARVAGIDIRVHFTLLLLIAYLAFGGLSHGPRGAAFAAATTTLLFFCITLHELGHSLVAQRLGVPVREIVLLPIGGAARLGRDPKSALDELLIAIAGPLVNVVIAVALASLALAVYGPGWFGAQLRGNPLDHGPSTSGLLAVLLGANATLALFNLLPALPMDGGRVLRALLQMFVGKARATRWASAVAQVLALGLAIAGLFGHGVGLMLIAAFVYLGAGQERAIADSGEVLRSFRAGEVCNPDAVTLTPGEHLGDAVDRILRTPQAYFAVLHGQDLVGVVLREEALVMATRVGLGAYVAAAMRPAVPAVAADLPLDQVRLRITELEGSPVAVMGDTGFLGLLGPDDLARIAGVALGLAKGGIHRPDAQPHVEKAE